MENFFKIMKTHFLGINNRLKLLLEYLTKMSVNRDIDKAIYFYKKSIKFGENLSYLNLANITLQGFENQPDINLAIAYSFIASKKKVENAKLFLDELLPYIKEKEWYKVEILISLIESEIKKM